MGTVTAYDYIIIGNGTAGATLARKLSDTKNGQFVNNVLVLEWGINRTADPIVENPNPLSPTSGELVDPPYSYLTKANTNFPSPGNVTTYSDAVMWGGGSSHNGMACVRGTKRIYDHWAKISGNDQWRYDNLLPLMIGLESFTPNSTTPFNPLQHGNSGPLFVTQPPALNPGNPFDSLMQQALEVPFINDPNDPTDGPFGVSTTSLYVTPPYGSPGSVRSSSATAFLPIGTIVDGNGKGLDGRKLTIVSNALVNRLLIRNGRADGVMYWPNGNSSQATTVYGDQIILCAGAVSSPAILERSGVGDGNRLRPLDIPVIVDNHNVGKHLTNQYAATVIATGYQTSGIPYFVAYTNGLPANGFTDDVRRLQVGALNIPNAVYFAGNLVLPQSRGDVHITSASPVDSKGNVHVLINLNMYSDYGGDYTVNGSDANLTVNFLQLMLDTYGQTATGLPTGGPAALMRYAKSLSSSSIEEHITGTTRMGRSEVDGVVDANLNVFGLKNVKIADIGIEPVNTDGNTAYGAFVIGLAAAKIILGGP